MKTHNKALALLFIIIVLSGCTVSMKTTNSIDDNGKPKITKELKLVKNTQVMKAIRTISVAILASKLDGGMGTLLPEIMRQDRENKKLEYEQKEKQKKIKL
ncbi:MAG TPA: hypothetical protein ENJ51_00670 [Leucothrix mucor]|uniref:Lipoprotein n=1 Tax=Leucothrix mucor TaxID=45248 RepID=A0A7V2SXK9_LEUMU|nr:hypothetical protein [Leucothrix mucor]